MDGFSIRNRVGSIHFILMRVWINGQGWVLFTDFNPSTSENSPPLKCEKLCFWGFSWIKPHKFEPHPIINFEKRNPIFVLKWIRHIHLSRYREKIVHKWSTCEKMTEIIWFQNILKNSKLSAHILILCMLFRFHLS